MPQMFICFISSRVNPYPTNANGAFHVKRIANKKWGCTSTFIPNECEHTLFFVWRLFVKLYASKELS